MCGGGNSGGGSNTVTQTQAIPDWQQGMVQANENIAQSIASQPYQTYQGQTVAGFSPLQQQGLDMTTQAANAGQPSLNLASNYTSNAGATYQPYQQAATQQIANATNAGQGQLGAANMLTGAATQQWNPQIAQQYMSPYAQAALQPQIQALQLQQGQDANKINSSATMAGAFGDAQYGNEQALNNFYAGQNLNNLEATGLNQAYQTGLGQFNTANQNLLSAGNQFGNLAGQAQQLQLNPAQAYSNLGSQAAGINLNQGSQFGNISNAQQQQGLAGANAVFNAGTQQQALNQAQLTSAYQNFLNQVNYPAQQLNLRIASTANNQYQVPTENLAPTSATAQNLGAFASLAGGVGSLLGGGGVYGHG